MHVRRGHYIGVAPVPGGLTNVCLVKPSFAGDADARRSGRAADRACSPRDPLLRDRAAGARLIGSPVVLGPLAVDVARRRDRRPAARRRRRRLHRSDDRRRPALRDLRRRTGRRRRAAGARARLVRRSRGPRRRARGAPSAASGDSIAHFARSSRRRAPSDAAALGARLAPAVLHAVIARAGDCSTAAESSAVPQPSSASYTPRVLISVNHPRTHLLITESRRVALPSAGKLRVILLASPLFAQ